MHKIYLYFFFLMSALAFAQNSYKADFKFGLYDEKQNFVDYKEFCESYKIISEDQKSELMPCGNPAIQKKDFYNKKKKVYTIAGKIEYGDLVRVFVKGQDTMLLVMNTNGGGMDKIFEIDTLQFSKGKFAILEEHVGHLDFKSGEVNYYNWVLKKFKSLGELTKNYEGSVYYVELNRLRAKYRIPGNDYNEKSMADLNKPKPAKKK